MTNNKLTLSHTARLDIAHYIRHCSYEIGGFGYVTMNEDGNFLVDEIFLVEQSVSSTTVDFADKGLEYAIQKAATDDRINDLKFCWHSHVNMGAFWSGTDDNMIANLNNGLTPYIVSLVQNKKGEHEQRVDFFPTDPSLRDFSNQITYDLDLYYQLPDIPEHIKQSYNALVTVERPPSYGTSKSKTQHKTYISETRQDYLLEKVAADGYNALSEKEASDYDTLLTELALSQHQLTNSMWDDYYMDDDFTIGNSSIDATPLSDLNGAKNKP